TEVPAESQLAYACDEPCLPPRLLCWVNGSTSQVIVDMNDLDSEKQIYYDNYIYISVGSSGPSTGTLSIQHWYDRILVLDVMHDARHLELQPLQPGKRSQLWRMRSDGRLFHEGTAPPRKSQPSTALRRHRAATTIIASCSTSPSSPFKHDLGEGIPLSLKRRDARRSSTQTWEFKQEGRMCCMHRNLCVQAKELKAGSIVVLASYPEGRVCLRNELCMRHKHIPGSGVLSLKVVRDGPTRVLRVVDIRQKRAGVLVSHRPDWTVLQSYTPNHTKLRVTVAMSKGLGVSLVSNDPEELVYITMNGVTMEFNAAHGEKSYTIKMQKVQIDNQLMQSRFPVVLSSRQSSSSSTDPLFSLHVVTQPSSSRTYEIYKSLSMDIGRTSLNLEEELLLKLVRFAGGGKTTSERDSQLLDETKIPVSATSAHRYYFEAIKLSMMPTHLSVYTASRLQPDLKAIKQSLSLTLVQFERAPVDLKPYTRNHLFETISFVIGDMTKFIREQMMGQAAMILGSVDFLGNPIGLLTDVKAGVSGLARGNLPNMLKHFSHGLSNSTALMTSSLSKGLGGLTMDEDYDEKRRLIQLDARDAGGHMVAGVQGLMAGMIGGLTGMITQPVKGAQEDGTKGLLKGIVKGVVGTVTKPVTGVLDLASESASAVREISLTKEQITHRVRRIRCCHSFQGCLQSYSESSAEGQQFLYSLNNRDYSEHYYSHLSLQVLITSKSVYFILGSDPDPERIMLLVDYNDLVKVQVLRPTSASSVGSSHAEQTTLELTIKSVCYISRVGYIKPQIICHSRNLAERVCQQINYAKTLFTEHTETLCYGATRDGHADR
uniref:Intermembrane lipid transfer protein VPS13-like C-terminal domain-containing protein n=1 Tax=Ciona savignyi TaxID=51511 RepID=H2ZA64_CIOSA